MTRVLVDGRLLEGGPSGVRDIAAGLVPALRALAVEEASDVIVAGTGPASDVFVPARGFMHFGLASAAVRFRCDAVLIPRQTRPALSPVRCVSVIHDVGFSRVPELYPQDARVLWANRLALGSRRVLAISAFTANEIRQLGARCVVDVLPLMAMHDISWDPVVKERYVLCIAAQEPHKNLARLVEAWSEADTGGARLVICGRPGRATQELQRTIGAYGVRTSVSVVSGLSDADYVALLSRCWAYVQPSYYEGLCIPALDMAAAGVPTATSNLANLGGVFGDADPRQVFDPYSTRSIAEALSVVINDMDTRTGISEWNRKNVFMTDWRAVANVAWKALK